MFPDIRGGDVVLFFIVLALAWAMGVVAVAVAVAVWHLTEPWGVCL